VRSRPEIKLYLDRSTLTPGSQLRASVALLSRSETPIDGIDVHLQGQERYYAAGRGKAATALHDPVNLVARMPGTMLAPGEHRREVVFDLPASAPPSYRGTYATIEYELAVHVDIPWWPDRTARYTVPVIAPSSPSSGAARAFCTDGRGPQGTALYLEASLDTDTVPLGGVVRGAVSIANLAQHRVRRVELSLVATEQQQGHGHAAVEVKRYTIELQGGAPPEGQAVPFRVALPEDAQPSLTAALVKARWHVEIRAVIALGIDVTLACPITVFRPVTGAPLGASPVAPVPPVGRERRALVWAESARRNGLASDGGEERMTLDLGATSLTVTLEARKAGGLALVAAVAWPRLGIDLAVAERRWVDAWSGGLVAIDDAAFTERFTVRGREAAQVLAFLDPESRRLLRVFDEAAVGDEGATLLSSGTAQSVDELDAFVSRAVAAARALDEAVRRVPPPATMAAYLPAWRAFATVLGGRLLPGEMSIHDGTYGEAPLVLATEWSREGSPVATVVRFPLPEPEGEREPHELTSATQSLVETLAAHLPALEVTPHHVESRLGATVADPAVLEPMLAAMEHLARQLTGGAARGPYR